MPKNDVILSALLATLATTAVSQPSFDCTKATSEAETLICADAELAALDRRMTERFSATQDAIHSIEAGGAQALQDLKATQRGWIKGRDDCWKSDDLRSCVENSYLMREAELVATWMLEDPKSVATYTCENNAANEVAIFSFETELPALRVEYGDSVRAAWQVPAASGSKYAMPFGGFFWTQGDEAQFEWVEGETMRCSVQK